MFVRHLPNDNHIEQNERIQAHIIIISPLEITVIGMHVQEHSLFKRFTVRHYCNSLSLFAPFFPCQIYIGSV